MHQIKKDHDDRAFSFFSNVTDTKPFRNPARKSNANPVTVSLFWFVHHIKKGEPFADNKDFKTIIEQIRSEPDPAKKTKLKKQLPCVSLSQICDPESRKITKSYSQLLQIDIDIKDNIDMFADAHKVTAIREKLAKDPFIVLACKSPSNALKCVIHYDSRVVTTADAHTLATAYFFDVYGLVIDKSCKDATRLFFATYDPEIHYNKKAQTLIYKYPFDNPFDADKPRFDVDLTYTPVDIPEFDDDVLTFDVGISIIDNEPKHNTPGEKTPTFDIDHIFEQIELQQIDLTHDYSDWLNFGFCFAHEYGEAGRAYYHKLSKHHPNYTATETDAKYNECLKNHNGTKTIASFLQACRKNKIHIRRKQNTMLTRVDKGAKDATPVDITYGTFWSLQAGKTAKIDIENLFAWLHAKYKLKYVKMTTSETIEKPAPLILTASKNNVLKSITISDVRNFIGQHIKSIKDAGERAKVENAILKDIGKLITDATLQTYLEYVEYNAKYDTSDVMYFAFKNGVIEVTANDISITNYKDADGFFWDSEVNKHNYEIKKDAENNSYADLISKITMDANLQESPKNYIWLRWLIGYSLHRRDRLQGAEKRMVILTENNIDPETANGGSGKNLVFEGLTYLRKGVVTGGVVFNTGSTFAFQNCNLDTHLYAVSDPKHFRLEHIYEYITGGVWVEKKNKQPFKVYPRIWGLFNTMIKGADDSDIRRMHVCIVSQFFNSGNLGRDYFKKELFTDFSENEWNSFYTFLFECCQLYLANKNDPPAYAPDGFLENKIELNTSTIFARFCEVHGGFENLGLWQLHEGFYLVSLDHFYSFYMLCEPNNNVSKNLLNRWFEVYLKAKQCKVRKLKKRLHDSKNPQWCFVVTPPKN
jgi:hypothetical protein